MRQLRTPILLAILAVTAALVYAPALDGPLLSDDHSYFTHNPYLSPLSRANLVALVDPFGPVAQLTANWAPVHVLAHAVGFHFFGPVTRGHHVVNVLVHLLNTGLLLALLRQNRVPWVLAAAGAALFLVHPANVEAVAWISQLKSSLATALGLAALLAHPRIPLLGAALFVLALLTKPTALAFLAFLVVWCLQEARAGRPAQWGWLGAWALLAGLFSVPAFTAFEHSGEFRLGEPLSPAEHVRWLLAIAGRYVAMAFTSWGCSTFAQPARPEHWLDGWVVLGLLSTAAVAARSCFVLVRGRTEAAFWTLAIGGYLPVSQIFPFRFPMADRYLYFVLPGLVGALALAATPALERALASQRARARRPAAVAAAAALLALFVGFAAHARDRARVWVSGEALLADSAAHYPDGAQGQLLRASRAAAAGRADEAVEALERAWAAGFDDVILMTRDPLFASLRDHPRFVALQQQMARTWIGWLTAKSKLSRFELQQLGMLHGLLGEWDAAVAAYERALAEPGPNEQAIRQLLLAARGERNRARARLERQAAGGDEAPGDGAPR